MKRIKGLSFGNEPLKVNTEAAKLIPNETRPETLTSYL